jgi:hypothetical protein
MAQAQQVERNFEAFTKLLPELLNSHPGKYAVMHDGSVVDFFDTLGDAVKFGRAQFGDTDFSVQEITRQGVNLGVHSYALYQHSS